MAPQCPYMFTNGSRADLGFKRDWTASSRGGKHIRNIRWEETAAVCFFRLKFHLSSFQE